MGKHNEAIRPDSGTDSGSHEPAAVWVPIGSLTPWDANPRLNDGKPVEQVAASIKRFGFASPIIARSADGEIIAGHTRLKAARALGLTRVPVRYVDLDPAESHLLALADNRAGEFADWDTKSLQDAMSEFSFDDIELAGWSAADLDKMAIEIAGGVAPDGDEIPDPPANPVTNLGDVWIMGRHVLSCGDSTGVSRPDAALLFDPPWDARPTAVPVYGGNAIVFSDGGRASDVISDFGPEFAWLFTWDCVSSWYTPNRPLRRSKSCFWYGDIATYEFDGAHYGEPGEPRTVTNTRGSYVHTPDPRGKHLSDVFSLAITQEHRDGMHPHSKPLDWIRMLIGCCTQESTVFDPYAGSGTTIIACEQLGRECTAYELSPAYCDVIVERWENLTGDKATRGGT